MTLQDIAQILGILLVSGSLIFVGLQMRQTHAIERGNAQRDILNQTREWWTAIAEDEETFDTFCAGLADFNSLTRYRQARFNALGWNLQHIVEGVFFQHKGGLVMASSHDGFMIAWRSSTRRAAGSGGRTCRAWATRSSAAISPRGLKLSQRHCRCGLIFCHTHSRHRRTPLHKRGHAHDPARHLTSGAAGRSAVFALAN